jgi:hypothetical protein
MAQKKLTDEQKEASDQAIEALAQQAPDTSASGKLIVRWIGNPNLCFPIRIGTYKVKGGRTVKYMDLDGNEADITLTPSKVSRGTQIYAEHQFEKDIPEQAHQAEFIKAYPFKALLGASAPKIRIIDEVGEAQEANRKMRNRNRILARIEEVISTEIGLRNLALNLGISVIYDAATLKPKHRDVVEHEVLDKADSLVGKPTGELEKILDDPTFEVKATLLYAKEKGIVSAKLGNWFFGDIHLGTSLEDSVRFLMANDTVTQSIVERTTRL